MFLLLYVDRYTPLLDAISEKFDKCLFSFIALTLSCIRWNLA